VCLDRWCRYDPALSDASRETSIPRIGVISTEVTPGAAGTVAANAAALGAQVSVLGATGDDGFAYELRAALHARGIAHDLLQSSREIATFTYTKLIHARTEIEDLPRVDFVNTEPLPRELDEELVRRLEAAAPERDVLLVSDQAETSQGGVVTAGMREALRRIAAANPHMVVWVDSRMRPELFRGAVVKPNRREADDACMRALGVIDYASLRRRMEAPLLVVTHGSDGAELIDETGSRWAHTKPVDHPVDICGAGDSFSAGAALALRITRNPQAAARFGNLVASITIMKRGTGTASPQELLT
jgi:rfaE bifunctional protein kinase chain/domain